MNEKNVSHTHTITMEFYSAIQKDETHDFILCQKRHEIMLFAGKQRELEIMLSEISLSEKSNIIFSLPYVETNPLKMI
jgi:hypothetical protein